MPVTITPLQKPKQASRNLTQAIERGITIGYRYLENSQPVNNDQCTLPKELRGLLTQLHAHGVLSSLQHIQWHVCESEGGRMAVTGQRQFESVVTELYQNAFVGSSIENGTTIIQFDLRKLDFQSLGSDSSKLASAFSGVLLSLL